MEPLISKSTLRAYFAGQATPLQRKLIGEWLQDDSHRDEYFRVLHEWEKENLQFLPDAEQDWQYLSARMEPSPVGRLAHSQQPPAPVTLRRLYPFYRLAVAAAVILVLLVGGWYKSRFVTYETAYGQVTTTRLADGSRVTLNANSTLRVPRFDWGNGPREVWLTGEAEFDVQHTADHRRFLVKTPDGVEVEVLGTEFVVFSRERGTKVALNKGKIQLRSTKNATGKPMIIRPGDVVSVDDRGAFKLRSSQPITQYSAWKEHRFVFDHTPLRDIAKQVQETFGVQVNIPNPALAARQLTGTYEAENAPELLQMVARLLDIRLIQQGQTATLQPKY